MPQSSRGSLRIVVERHQAGHDLKPASQVVIGVRNRAIGNRFGSVPVWVKRLAERRVAPVVGLILVGELEKAV